MGRSRSKGRDVTGWLVFDKPAGMTSTQAVGMARRIFDAKKAGHAGTLDPAATGVLAIAFGEATKTVPFVQEGLKTYRFGVAFGAATDTDDAEGVVIAEGGTPPEGSALDAALAQFRGQIMQRPPRYSAVKIDGERAYDLAREGVEVEIKERPLWVERLDLISPPDDQDVAVLEMICGKGGYVRAIARDLGEALGCPAHCAWLRRESTGPFGLDQAMDYAALEAGPGDDALLPLEAGLAELPKLHATEPGAVRLQNGNPGAVLPGEAEYGDLAWAERAGQALAVGRYRGGELHPERVFRHG